MSTIKSLEELKRLRDEALRQKEARATTGQVQVTVAMGTCGIAAGARETVKAILQIIEGENLDGVLIKQTGCMGICEWEPIVQVQVGENQVRYGKVSPERAERIMKEHVMEGKPVTEFQIPLE